MVGRDALLVLDLRLDVVDGVRRLNLKGDRLASQGLNENLHTTTQTEHQVKGGLLLDVVIGERTAILKLLAGEDEALLVRGDTKNGAISNLLNPTKSKREYLPLLILDLGLDVVDGIRRLDLKRDGLAGQRLHEDLHTATEAEDEMKGGLLLDVIIREGTAVLELLASEDEALLIGRDTAMGK